MKLSVTHAAFHYDPEKIHGFNDVSFTLNQIGLMTILGPNACGKTTLLKCIDGLLKLEQGRISINGKDLRKLTRVEIARTVGFVPQFHQPTFAFSVLDVVLVGRAPHIEFFGSPDEQDIAIARHALEVMGISYLADEPYTQLSGGERQMVLLARILAQQPSLLLLDEPTSHLDFGNQIRFLNTLQKLAKNGLPIIMTSHFPDHAFLSDKVALMKDGVLIEMGTPDEVITEQNLEKVYNVKVKVITAEGINRKICVPTGEPL